MSSRLFACRIALRARALLASSLCATLLAGCQPQTPPLPNSTGKLSVAIRPGPTSWFPGADGVPTGFDHDLLARFARSRGLTLEVVEVDSAVALIAKVAAGEVHVGAGGLYSPAPATTKADAARADPRPVLWTNGYFAVEPVLVYGTGGFRPESWRDLAGAQVAYLPDTGIEAELAAVRAAHPEFAWIASPLPTADALIAGVSEGRVDYAVMPSTDAVAARSVFLEFDQAFTIGPKRDLAWAVAPAHRALRDDINAFFTDLRRDGALARYAEHYFHVGRPIERIDAGVFHERIRTVLPQYRQLFAEAQLRSGIEWRLLAAVAYQESQWDPFAVSETGVRGFMQITEDTARKLGVTDLLDPRQSAIAGARYLAELSARLPARIVEPDRTWLALAAFNIGPGHLEDARVLAQRQKLDPDRWSNVRSALPLLALPEHFALARNGYARGGMPVAFVDRVRAYYDILLRHEQPAPPRLHAVPVAEPR